MNQTLRVSSLSLINCLGILVLLVSPSLAQVNGPGPSSSSLFDTVVNLPGDEAIISGGPGELVGLPLGQTTQLNVSNGGTVGDDFLALPGSEVNISGGAVGTLFDALPDSEVNISGGTVGGFFDANEGSEVSVSGGTVGLGFLANNGSLVNISGGTFSSRFEAEAGSVVSISGGSFGPEFDVNAGSDVELIGGEFRLNGVDFSGSTITLADNDIFTGTMSDGSTFIFSDAALDSLTNVTLTAADLPTANLSPIVVNAPIVSGPSGLRAGQTLTLQAGGSLRDNFAVVDATLNVEEGILGASAEAINSVVNISGGEVGFSFDAYGSVVNISGGEVGDFSSAFDGSVVNISGGELGVLFDANSGSEVNISGGFVGFAFNALPGSVVNVSGGRVSNFFNAFSGSEVNISGGTFEVGFSAFAGSEVNLLGTRFFIDGLELDTLQPGEAFTITDQGVSLSGVLADGEQFSFNLDFFDPGASITVTTVPNTVLLGDVNLDGVVNFLDIQPFIERLTGLTFQFEADINRDGVVSFFDIQLFIDILSGP